MCKSLSYTVLTLRYLSSRIARTHRIPSVETVSPAHWQLFVITHIDDCLLELPGGYLAVEQNIDLTIRPVLKLWKEEVGEDTELVSKLFFMK